jgi:hypothetical protein
MSTAPTLDEGELRLQAPSGRCTFVFRRPKPGVVLLTASGDDRGELGSLPRDVLEREAAQHGPLRLFLDARELSDASGPTRQDWTRWLQQRRGATLAGVSILVGSRYLGLVMDVAKHLSGTGDLVQVLAEPAAFSKALSVAAGRPLLLGSADAAPAAPASSAPARAAPATPSAPARAAPEAYRREAEPGTGLVRLRSARCTFTFARPRPGVLWVRAEGHDAGEFSDATLREMEAALGERPLHLLVDARDADGPPVAVSQEWTAWLARHRERLARMDVLVGSRVLHLTVSIAQHLSRTGALLRLHETPGGFTEALAQAAPGWTPPPASPPAG